MATRYLNGSWETPEGEKCGIVKKSIILPPKQVMGKALATNIESTEVLATNIESAEELLRYRERKHRYAARLRENGFEVDVLDPDTLRHLSLERIVSEVGIRWPSAQYTTRRFRGKLLSMACRVGRVDVLAHYYKYENGMPEVLTRRFISIARKYNQDQVLLWLS